MLGGVLAAVLDFAVSTAVLTSVDIDTTVVTANLNVYVHPTHLHPDSRTLRCIGTLVHRGHRSAFADRDPHRHRWPHPRTSRSSHLPAC